ncbi:RNA polymerase sigma factor [Litoribacillus peritrichatus]
MSKQTMERLTSIFHEYASEINQFLSLKVGPDAAQDLSQEVYLRFSQLERPDNIQDVKAYLFRVAQNLVIDYWRKQQRLAEVDLPDTTLKQQKSPSPTPDQILASQQQYALFQQAIKKMPSQCRVVFLLHKINGLTYSQVAENLGISHKTVEKHISKALKICKKELKWEGGSF